MACQPLEYRTKVLGNTVLSLGIRPPPETNEALGIPPGSFFDEVVRSRGLEPPHPYGYMHLKHARLPIPPRPQNSLFDPTSSHTYLKLVRLPLLTERVRQSRESGFAFKESRDQWM